MFGLIVLVVIGLYLLISVGVVRWAISYAKKNGKSVKRWGWGAALVMYLLVFWDWIPTVVAHKYYCSTEAGFWVYKTPEQWKKENPGVMETLDSNPSEQFRIDSVQGNKKLFLLSDGTQLVAYYDVRGSLIFVNFNKPDGSEGYWLNERLNVTQKKTPYFPLNYMMREEQQLMDSKTGDVLERYVDYSNSHKQPQAGWNGWKMWLFNEHCVDGGSNQDLFRNFRDNFVGKVK